MDNPNLEDLLDLLREVHGMRDPVEVIQEVGHKFLTNAHSAGNVSNLIAAVLMSIFSPIITALSLSTKEEQEEIVSALSQLEESTFKVADRIGTAEPTTPFKEEIRRRIQILSDIATEWKDASGPEVDSKIKQELMKSVREKAKSIHEWSKEAEENFK